MPYPDVAINCYTTSHGILVKDFRTNAEKLVGTDLLTSRQELIAHYAVGIQECNKHYFHIRPIWFRYYQSC